MRGLAAGLALLVAGSAAGPAAAQSVVLALSTEEVRIASNFTGTGLTVFAVVERGDGESGLEDYALAVVVRGPPEDIVTRRQDQVLGLWFNRGAVTFEAAPAFYAVRTTAPLEEIAGPEVLEALGIGLGNLRLEPPAGTALAAEVVDEYRAAFIRLKRADGLYSELTTGIDSPGAGIYRATFGLPANVPLGLYRVALFLFRSGSLVATAGDRLEISQTGAEQFISVAAREAAWPYAIAVVAMALSVGWLGGVIFRRD